MGGAPERRALSQEKMSHPGGVFAVHYATILVDMCDNLTVYSHFVNSHFVNSHFVNSHSKWELTKWELTKWEVDEVGRFTILYTSNHCYRSVKFLVHH